MDLKDYILDQIKQVADALAEGGEYCATKGVTLGSRSLEKINFDVACIVTSEKTDKVGGGVKVAHFIEFGGRQENGAANQSISRIQFSVPYKYTNQKPEDKQLGPVIVLPRGARRFPGHDYTR